jgi:hypothetical protein
LLPDLGAVWRRQSAEDQIVARILADADLDRDNRLSFGEFLLLMQQLRTATGSNCTNLLRPNAGVRKSEGAAGASIHSYSDEEKRAFTSHINHTLAKDPHVGGRLPMNTESEQVGECSACLSVIELFHTCISEQS